MNCPYCQKPFIDVSYLIKQYCEPIDGSDLRNRYQLWQCNNHPSVAWRISIDLETNSEVHRLFFIHHKQRCYGIDIFMLNDPEAFEIRRYSQANDDPNLYTQHEYIASFPTSASRITPDNALSKLQTILLFL